jgi:spore maturation protein CgeB
MARTAEEMQANLRAVLLDSDVAQQLRTNGLEAVRKRHSCRHRVQELLDFYHSIKTPAHIAQATEAA